MTNTNALPVFDFFEVVQIVDTDGRLSEIDRKLGVVLGRSINHDGNWGYAVQVCDDQACDVALDGWDIDEKNLVATGGRVSEDYVYGGGTIKVSQSGEIID